MEDLGAGLLVFVVGHVVVFAVAAAVDHEVGYI